MSKINQSNSKHIIYQITVPNFRKYNQSLKKGHKATLISNNFCTDAELRTLPMSTRWMFLGIVLTCGDFGDNVVRMSSKDLRDLLECNRNIDRELDSLKELQALSYEKFDLLNNRKEYKEKRKEDNRGENPQNFSGKSPEQPSAETKTLLEISVEEAEVYFLARRKYASSNESFEVFMGPERMNILKQIGGKSFLFKLEDNDFGVRRLAKLIQMQIQFQTDAEVHNQVQ